MITKVKNWNFYIIALCFLQTACSQDEPSVVPTEPTTVIEEPEREIDENKFNVDNQKAIRLVNELRQSGCICGSTMMPSVGPLVANDELSEIALAHSEDMLKNNFFSHTSSYGASPKDRINNFGVKWTSFAENIAFGHDTEEQVIDAWQKSEHHCKNMMNANLTDMGIAKKDLFWTQVFISQ